MSLALLLLVLGLLSLTLLRGRFVARTEVTI